MSLFEFKHYGMPTGQVFIPTHEEEGPPFEGHNIDQYVGKRPVHMQGILLS